MITEPGRPAVLAVVGATAVGKSDLAIALARQLGGEVVNADSMQLYRGMDVGTAKLPVPERARRAAPPARRVGRAGRGQRRRLPAAGPGLHRRRARTAGGCPSWSAARGCTCGRLSTTSTSPAPIPRSGPGSRPSSPAERRRRAAPPAGRRRPGGRGEHPAEQRPPPGPRAGGRRAHRPAVRGDPARPPVRRAGRAARPDPAPAGARRPDRGPGRPDVAARPGRGGTPAGGSRPARRPDGVPGARLRPGAAVPRRGSSPSARRATRRSAPPGGSPGGRSRGSAATRGSAGWTPPTRSCRTGGVDSWARCPVPDRHRG